MLGATFNNYNLGVGALATGVVTCIAECAPDPQISLLDYAREPHLFHLNLKGRMIPIQTVNVRMKPYPAKNIVFLTLLALALRSLPVKGIRAWLISKNRVLHHIQTSDVIVSIAGGDSFSDIYGLRRLIDVSLPQALVLILGKELILLPQTLGPFKGRIGKTIARSIMRRAGMVYSRDRESLREATVMIGGDAKPGKMKFCYDVGFMVQPQRPLHLDLVGLSLEREAGSLVGLNLSGLLFMGGYKRDDTFGFRDKYIEFAYKVIDLMISRTKARVLLVPHTLGSGCESDSDVCTQFYEELKTNFRDRIGFVRGLYTTAEMKYVIGQCNFFIGSRMHACIAALSQGIPAVSVAYSRKFVGVLETLGIPELLVDPRVMTVNEMLNIIGESYDRREEIRMLLEAKLPEVKKSLLSLMPAIFNHIQQPALHSVGVLLDSSERT